MHCVRPVSSSAETNFDLSASPEASHWHQQTLWILVPEVEGRESRCASRMGSGLDSMHLFGASELCLPACMP